MELILDERVKKFVRGLEKPDRVRVGRYIDLFEEFGFRLPTKYPKYLKKVEDGVWELRPGYVRIFIYNRGDLVVAVHGTVKSAPKIKQADLNLIRGRVKQWEIK